MHMRPHDSRPTPLSCSWRTPAFVPCAEASDYPHNPKGEFKLREFKLKLPGLGGGKASSCAAVRTGSEGFTIMDGKASLPLRHSLAEHQKAWVKSIEEAIQGTLTPGPEDEAAIAMAMKNMSTNAKEGREGSLTSGASTKVVSCVKSWGLLGLTVKNSARGAGTIDTHARVAI